MCTEKEENAYAEIFSHLFQNDGLRQALIQTLIPQQDGVVLQGVVAINSAVGGAMNIHGFWYLTHRTCQAEAVRMIAEWLWSFGQGQAGTDAYMSLTDPKEFRTHYTDWLKTKAKWWEKGFGSIVVNGIGPWPKTGTGGD
ncbi:MAG: hypothetical protein JW779_02390 [Candidatus Thorarchaeota archaeon]|nr:hypothetical protein [Candidatus Thorarchaeota archaeon]